MKIGYARVSTEDQHLELQIDALTKAGCERIYQEHASGKNTERPELARMLEALREGDTVVVYKLDRISRSVQDLESLAKRFAEMGVEFASLSEQIDTSTPMGKFFFHVMGAISELERDIIVERTMAGLAAARARGRVGGRKPADQRKVKHALALYDSRAMSVSDICATIGISRPTLYKYLHARDEAKKAQAESENNRN